MTDVLLVSCYELGHQPLAVASPAAHLRAAGRTVETLDVSVEGFDPERIARASLVAISVPMHTALRLGVEVARRVRESNPAAHVVFFGLYATLNAGYLRDAGLADTVLSGEVEPALVELAAGAAPRSGARLEKIGFLAPDRRGLPDLERYAHLDLGGELRAAGAVEASRGCKHLCRHCPIPPVYRGRFFVVPVDVVLADVAALARAGARHVTFADPDFLNGPTHARRVVRAIHEAHPDLTFDFTAKVEHLRRHAALLPEFRAAGCLFVVSAAESLSDLVLARLAKGHTRADLEAVLDACRAAGVALRPTFVPFTPWSTLGDYLELLDFVAARGLVGSVDPVQYTLRLLVPPGSELLEGDALRPFLGRFRPEDFAWDWTHPDPRMDDLQREVARRVEEGVDRDEPAPGIFEAIRAAADRVASRRGQRPAAVVPAAPAPRLTEPWFC